MYNPLTRLLTMLIGALVIGVAASTRASDAGELSAPLCVAVLPLALCLVAFYYEIYRINIA